MKLVYTLLSILSIVHTVHAQLLTVKDMDTKKPIVMATVSSLQSEINKVSNTDGQVDISQFEGIDSIEIRSLGYVTQMVSYASLSKSNFEVFLKPSTTKFDEIVVSATRSRQSARSVPSKITVISPKDVALFNPQTAADLLGSSGEVFIQKSQQGGGSPMIRGFATNRLLYTVDGVRMNSAIFRSGNIQNVISLDPLVMENTEVFFGPGSIIYGSDAIGGVMSFQTLTPKLSLVNKLLISGNGLSRYTTANGEWTHHFDINVANKKWSFLTSFTHSKFGDLKMGKYGPDDYLKPYFVKRIDGKDSVLVNPNPRVQVPTGYSQINVMQKIRYQPHQQWDLQYGLHYSRTSAYSRYDRLIETQANGQPISAVWDYGPQIWMMNNLTALHTGQNVLYDRMTLRLAQQYFEESRIDRRLNNHRLRTNREEVKAYSANIDLEKKSGNHNFNYGTEYVLNDVNSFGFAVDIRNNNPIKVPDRYPQSHWSSYAGYLNYQFTLSQKVLVQSGIRYNVFNINSDFSRHLEFYPFDFSKTVVRNASTTGSLGFVITPDRTWKISLHGSTGFRAPNVDDMGKIFDFVAGDVIVPNTSLRAEYAYNGEMNISKWIGEYIKLDVTGFYTYLDNAMVRRPFKVGEQDSIVYNGQMSRVYAIQNAAFGTVYGLNAAVEIKLPRGISLSSKYNIQRGREALDNGFVSASRHAAPAFGITRINYQKDALNLQLYCIYNAAISYDKLNLEEQGKPAIYAKDTNGNPYSPRWYTFNFKAGYEIHQNITLHTGVENITDQRYRPYSSGLVAPGRNFIFSMRVSL